MDEVDERSGEDGGVALAALVDVEAGGLSERGLLDTLVEAHRARARLDAAITRLTDRLDADAAWVVDGARHPVGWMTGRTGCSHGTAHAEQRLARQLRPMPHVRSAAAAGRLTRDQVRILVKACQPGLEDTFAVCEAMLVDEVARLQVAAGQRYLRRWAQGARERLGLNDPDGPEPTGGHGRSTFRLSPVGDRWAGDLDLSAEDGEALANALDAEIDAMWRAKVFTTNDGLSQPERRADALIELIRRGALGGADGGTATPLILGLIPMDRLRTPPPGARAATSEGTGAQGGRTDDHVAHNETTPPTDTDASTRTRHGRLVPTEHGAHPADSPGPHGRRAPDALDDHDPTDVAPSAGPVEPEPTDADPPATSTTDDDTTRTPSPPWSLPDGVDDLDDHQPAGDPLAHLDPTLPFPAALCELSRSGPVPAHILAALACEGAVVPVYIGDGADQLNMGRALRIANRAQRRALRVRDGGCQFPGCDIAPEYCIAHHLVWWEHGGRTDLVNLVLLCRHHHTLIHKGTFAMARGPDGALVTSRTDRRPTSPTLRGHSALLDDPTTPEQRQDEADRIHATRLARRRIDALCRQARRRRGEPVDRQ